MDNADQKFKDLGEKINAIREKANKKPVKKTCQDLMEEICDGKKKAEDVKCCKCNQLTLKKIKKGTSVNPYESIECYYVGDGDIQCGFIYTCGQSQLSPPENKSNLNIF